MSALVPGAGAGGRGISLTLSFSSILTVPPPPIGVFSKKGAGVWGRSFVPFGVNPVDVIAVDGVADGGVANEYFGRRIIIDTASYPSLVQTT
jgi:hypothetical protein